MDQQTLQRLKQALSEAESLGIAVGPNPTVDEMGAALALFISLKTANKKVSVASPTQPIVELSSLVGIDQVRNTLGSSAAGDLVVSFPYKEGEIEKVSYTLENGFLNIVVKAGELGLNFSDDEVQFQRGGAVAPSHLLLVGVRNVADLGEIFNPDEMKDVTIINIDNKPDNTGYGEIVLVNPRMSSVSEIVSEILLSSGMPADVDIAQNLLSGISYATANFQDPKTSFMAFEMAGELMRLGAVRTPMAMPNPMSSIPAPRPQPRYAGMDAAATAAMDDYDMVDAPMPAPLPRPQPRMPQTPSQRMSGQQPMPRPGQRPPMPQRPQNQAMGPRPSGQQSRMAQQPQRPPMPQQRPQMQQQQQPRSRQDEIREELARAAAAQANGQAYSQEPYNQPMTQPEPSHQPQQDSHAQTNGHSQNPPSDWLTPKVYKGSSDVHN